MDVIEKRHRHPTTYAVAAAILLLAIVVAVLSNIKKVRPVVGTWFQDQVHAVNHWAAHNNDGWWLIGGSIALAVLLGILASFIGRTRSYEFVLVLVLLAPFAWMIVYHANSTWLYAKLDSTNALRLSGFGAIVTSLVFLVFELTAFRNRS